MFAFDLLDRTYGQEVCMFVMCNSHLENGRHIFTVCEFARECWIEAELIGVLNSRVNLAESITE